MPLDPVLRLGPIPIHWYGVAYAIAFFVGIRLVTPYLLRHGISQNDCNFACGTAMAASRSSTSGQRERLWLPKHLGIRHANVAGTNEVRI